MSESRTQEWVRFWHGQGFIPIRLASNSKKAIDPGWQHSRYATADDAARHFAGHEGNVGITFPSTIVALDLDRKKGSDGVAEIEKLGQLPTTMRAKTPSNGVHALFRLPAGVTVPNGVGVLPGVDLRTAGGYIVVEPSTINGLGWVWDRPIAPLAELPHRFVEDLLRRRSTPAAPAAETRRIPAGARNATLTSMAGGMRRDGFAVDAIAAALHVVNEQQCEEPVDDVELSTIARSVGRYAPEPAAWEIFASPGALPAGASPEPPQTARTPRVSLADLFTHPEGLQRFLIAQILPGGVLTLLGAHGGVGKSTLALTAAVCLVTGRHFMGRACERCKVVFFSAEDPAPVIRRRLGRICRQLAVDPVELAAGLLVLDATESPVLYDGAPTGQLEALRLDVTEFEPGAIVIDNASDTFDSNEIERARVRAFVRHLASLGKPTGAAVLLLAHVDKQTVKAGGSEGYSGSTAWHNSARSRLFLTAVPGGLKLEHQKSNLGQRAQDIHIRWTPDGLLESGEAPGGPDDTAAVLRLISAANDAGQAISPKSNAGNNAFKVLSASPEFPTGLTRDALERVIASLKFSGQVIEEEFSGTDRKSRWRLRAVRTVAES